MEGRKEEGRKEGREGGKEGGVMMGVCLHKNTNLHSRKVVHVISGAALWPPS
jgi:hypothetical protein